MSEKTLIEMTDEEVLAAIDRTDLIGFSNMKRACELRVEAKQQGVFCAEIRCVDLFAVIGKSQPANSHLRSRCVWAIRP